MSPLSHLFSSNPRNLKQQKRSPLRSTLVYSLGFLLSSGLLALSAIASELDSRIEDLDRSLPVESTDTGTSAPASTDGSGYSGEDLSAPASGEDWGDGTGSSGTDGSGNVYQGAPASGSEVYAPPTPRPTRPPAVIPLSSQPSLTKIDFGDVKPGVLGEADPRTTDGRRYEYFQFEGREGQPIVITLNGSEDPRRNSNLSLKPYMIIYGPNGEIVARNDVAAGTRTLADERLRIRLPEAGTYKVAVFADPGAVGRFGLSLQRDTVIYRYEWADNLTDESVRLNSDDSATSYYQFSGTQGQFVNILAISPDFDAYLFLLDSEGNVIAQDNDSGGNLNALIQKELPASGTYTIVVNAFGSEGRGRYRLVVY